MTESGIFVLGFSVAIAGIMLLPLIGQFAIIPIVMGIMTMYFAIEMTD